MAFQNLSFIHYTYLKNYGLILHQRMHEWYQTRAVERPDGRQELKPPH